jgi:uracil-DNA glycosylase
MSHDFDEGYALDPFRTLCREYPDDTVYPAADFRSEWGPIFHRGRLDGSARVLLIGQDPAAHESIARRILVGVAGQRAQGFLGKLGITRSYVFINTFLYSVVTQDGGTSHQNNAALVDYRNRWIDAIFDTSRLDAVVALGSLAQHAWTQWKSTPKGKATTVAFAHITHPTADRNVHGDAEHAMFVMKMLHNWNNGLAVVAPAISQPDADVPLVPYGSAFKDSDLVEIPEIDFPAGTPAWMRGLEPWATRTGDNAAEKRATIQVVVPGGALPAVTP